MLLPEILSTNWDIIIIGSGMGGSVAAFELSKNYKVLLLERGPSYISHSDRLSLNTDDGRFLDNISLNVNNDLKVLKFPIGNGSGGGTLLYGAQLERFKSSDFEYKKYCAKDEYSNNFIDWPISLEDLDDYYKRAEDLFKISNIYEFNRDKLNYNPVKFKYIQKAFFDEFKKLGLAPYYSNVAYDFIEGCTGCGSKICINKCKNDAAKICIQPALINNKLYLLNGAEVIKINTTRENEDHFADGVVIIKDNKKYEINGKMVILASGALSSPKLLFNSANTFFPQGLGNISNQLGKNLMFHNSDFFLIKPKKYHIDDNINYKFISTDYFYIHEGVKYGTFQSVGIQLNSFYISKFLINKFNIIIGKPNKLILKIINLFSLFCEYFSLNRFVFASIIEDYPYPHNYVNLNTKDNSIHYTISNEQSKRSFKMKDLIREKIKDYYYITSISSKINLNLGHPCGTCRMGFGPNDSVLNKYNQVHFYKNLYVLDSSFFVSSGSTNPSLTIAANSLRVSDYINKNYLSLINSKNNLTH